MGDSSDDPDDPSARCTERLVNAYKRASSMSDAADELRCLQEAGVILPNGITPFEPLQTNEGEWLLSFAQGEEALAKMGRNYLERKQ